MSIRDWNEGLFHDPVSVGDPRIQMGQQACPREREPQSGLQMPGQHGQPRCEPSLQLQTIETTSTPRRPPAWLLAADDEALDALASLGVPGSITRQ